MQTYIFTFPCKFAPNYLVFSKPSIIHSISLDPSMALKRAYSVAQLDSLQRIAGRKEFDESVKVLQESIDGGKISIVQKNGIIYATKTIPTPTIQVTFRLYLYTY